MQSQQSKPETTSETNGAPPEVKVLCSAFQKNPDGSWTSTQNSDIQTPEYTVRINPGIRFNPGRVIWGVNVVEALDYYCTENTSSANE